MFFLRIVLRYTLLSEYYFFAHVRDKLFYIQFADRKFIPPPPQVEELSLSNNNLEKAFNVANVISFGDINQLW